MGVVKKLFSITYQALEQQMDFHSSTVRVLHAKDLFEKLPFFLTSFITVYENSFLSNIPDDNTLASISRNIIELRNVFQYVIEYRLSKEESEFRSFSMELHRATREKEILEKLGVDDGNVTLRWGFILSLVKENPFCQSLNESERKKVLKAQKPYYWEFMKNKKELFEKGAESALYDLLSNLTHSFPLSNSIRRETPYSLIFSYEKVLAICCEVTIIYSASIVRDYLSLRSTVFRNLIYKEREFLKNCLDPTPLLKFINENKIQKGGLFSSEGD